MEPPKIKTKYYELTPGEIILYSIWAQIRKSKSFEKADEYWRYLLKEYNFDCHKIADDKYGPVRN